MILIDRADTLYLDDLHVGQRFASATHLLDAPQIKNFAAQLDPQPFHLKRRVGDKAVSLATRPGNSHFAQRNVQPARRSVADIHGEAGRATPR
jgi:acyl dehydratase